MQVTATTATPGVQETLDRLNAPATITRPSAAAALDSADFLRLMTAQLANQDPLEPQGNEEMLAQLAQFSTLEAQSASQISLAEISSKLDALIAAQQSAATAAQASLEAATKANAEPAPTEPSGAGTSGSESEFTALT
jgi:flagellar basal-body rod modification protein FlgD